MNVKSKLDYALKLLNSDLRNYIKAIDKKDLIKINEIRLRANKKLSVNIEGKEKYVLKTGGLSDFGCAGVDITCDNISYTYQEALMHSIYSFKKEICNGYVITEGGNRVGFCGTPIYDNNKQIDNIKNISSISIRIAREVFGCGDEVLKTIKSNDYNSLLILGPPSCGKTTILRDICRQIGSKKRISIIDEKNEISATFSGSSQNDVGDFSDVFNSYNKYEGILTAVRVMSPEFLICDEIGTATDLEALDYAINSGVKLISTIHCDNIEDLHKKAFIKKLIKRKAYKYLVLLGTGEKIGKIIDVKEGF